MFSQNGYEEAMERAAFKAAIASVTPTRRFKIARPALKFDMESRGLSIYKAVYFYLQDQYPHLNTEQLHGFTNTIDQYIVDEIPSFIPLFCELCHGESEYLIDIDDFPEHGYVRVCQSCFDHNR